MNASPRACSCEQPDCPGTGGGYYVSVIDGPRHALLTGPYNAHRDALDDVERVRAWAEAHDPRSAFYAFGTARRTEPGPHPAGRFHAAILSTDSPKGAA